MATMFTDNLIDTTEGQPGYHDDSPSSSDDTARHSERRPILQHGPPRQDFLFVTQNNDRPSGSRDPMRPTPISAFYTSGTASDTDSDANGSFSRSPWLRTDRQWWSTTSRRRRKRDGRIARFLRRWCRRIVRHPFFPQQPFTIMLSLTLFCIFAISMDILITYLLNPDKEPLPWRAYCAIPSMANPAELPLGAHRNSTASEPLLPMFPPDNLDTLPPAGVFIGVFTVDSGFERRAMIRTTWASHPRSRDGAGEGDLGVGTSRTIVRFIIGQPRKDWERRIALEIEMYNDIVILPISENMNGGKSHTYFSWASINAWVPPIYGITTNQPSFTYSNYSSAAPKLAPHDSHLAWKDQLVGKNTPWVRPDFVVKMDDDAFLMLAEIESRLRVELHKPSNVSETQYDLAMKRPPRAVPVPHDPLVYWGYLVKNRLHRFIAGEVYALSWSLVDWVAKDPTVKGLTKGAEDKQTAKWMRLHPNAEDVKWASERCWIYDHPRAGTVYAHGFLYPSEVKRIQQNITRIPSDTDELLTGPAATNGGMAIVPRSWAHSSVSVFGTRYVPPSPEMGTPESVEALVEGSEMSMLTEGSAMVPKTVWHHREGRNKRYLGKRVGGTVAVHFIKKNMWYLETAMALLDGDETTEAEWADSEHS